MSARISQKLRKNILRMLPLAVARSSFDDNAMSYKPPVFANDVKLRGSCLLDRMPPGSAVFTCTGALGTPSRTGPLARKYLPGFPYS